jgi:hypothetical protein
MSLPTDPGRPMLRNIRESTSKNLDNLKVLEETSCTDAESSIKMQGKLVAAGDRVYCSLACSNVLCSKSLVYKE